MNAKRPGIGEPGWRPTEVHPLAARFPVLPDDDLASLAEDIKTNGLLHPLVIDEKGTLIDGRMRLDACNKAGVEPRYEQLNGHDAVSLIWSNNGKRRHMTKGQMAMIAAMEFDSSKLEERKRGNADKGYAKAAAAAGVPVSRFSEAMLVRQYASHLVDDVIAGTKGVGLDAAYAIAQAAERAELWRIDGLRMLGEQDSDLAARIRGGEMTIDIARKHLEERKKAAHAMRDSVLLGMTSGLGSLIGFEQSSALHELPEQLGTDDGLEHFRHYFKGGAKELGNKLDAAERGLAALREVFTRINRRK